MTHLFDAAVNNGFMEHAKLEQLALQCVGLCVVHVYGMCGVM